ncbi:MAG: hypothetical protein RL653_1770 [Pseudomonadota bacterium]|jgi:hypothetical protein
MGTGNTLESLSGDLLRRALEWAYDQALRPGIPGVESVDELIDAYQLKGNSRRDCAESLVRWQAARCAGTGFVLAFGGVTTLPLTLTADLATSYFVQLRMVAAIAGLGGKDPQLPDVRNACLQCLMESDGAEPAAQRSATFVFRDFARKRFLVKTAPKNLRRFGRVVPVVGGVINGSLNGVLTWKLGQTAIRQFIGP